MDTAAFERSVLDLVNAERSAQGLEPWREEYGLSELARRHSKNMALEGFWGHTDHEGLRILERQQKYDPGLLHSGIGENLFKITNSGFIFKPESVIAGWMESPTHRENILETHFTHCGIGVFQLGYNLFITQIAAAPIIRLPDPLPDHYSSNNAYELECVYLSPEPKDDFLCALRTPDPSTRVKVSDTVYFEGTWPLGIRWLDDSRFILSLDFPAGPGEYKLQLGWGASFYPHMYIFKAD